MTYSRKMMTLPKVNHLARLTELLYSKFFWIAIINFFAHFWYFRDLGLYEDDHFRIPMFMTLNHNQVLASLWTYLTHPAQFQGRPLHESFILMGSFLGSHLGGLSTIYLIAYGLSTLNAFLFYRFTIIITNHQKVALLSTFFFVLFPTDTNQIWLTSAFGIRTSLIFLFLAFICYLKNKKVLSYFIIFTSLFCYETIYWIFLVAPFLEDRPFVQKRFRIHGFFLFILFAFYIILRKFSGESRISDLNIWQTLQMSIGQIGLGVWSILRSYPEALKSTWLSVGQHSSLLILMLLSFFVFYGLLTQSKDKLDSINFPVIKYIFIFACMILLSYPLNLTVWANQLSGVYTRVNMAASVGTSLLLGTLSSQLITWGQKVGYRQWLNIGLSMLLSSLVGFGLILQKDYQLNWQYQKVFWQEVLPLISDIQSGEFVLVDAKNIQTLNTQQMRGNDWNTNIVLSNIFQFPASIKPPPKVYLLTPDWSKKILAEQSLLRMSTATLVAAPAHLPTVNQESLIAPSSVILIQSDHQKLYRSSIANIQGTEIHFKQKSIPTLTQLPHGVLYPYIY